MRPFSFFKRLFCPHHIQIFNRWHICHGPNGNDPAEIEVEYICNHCGKVIYQNYPIMYKKNFEHICPQYERRMR